MSRRIFGFAEWLIGPTRDSEGRARAPQREVVCATCEDASRPSTDQTVTDRWAMQHAGLTGHREYLELTTTHLTAAPAPTNPLYEQDRKVAR